MVKRSHISVEIDATFGSSFQGEVAVRMLGKYIAAWRAFFLEKHSKNAIDFRVINAEISSPLPRRRPRSVKRHRQPAQRVRIAPVAGRAPEQPARTLVPYRAPRNDLQVPFVAHGLNNRVRVRIGRRRAEPPAFPFPAAARRSA